MAACRRHYGGVVSFNRVAGERFVMVLDPEPAKEVLHAPADRLTTGSTNASLQPLVGASSVVLADGAEHVRLRRMLLACLQGDPLTSHETAILDRTDRTIDAWPVGEPFPLLPSVTDLTLDLIVHMVLGPAEPGARERVRDVFDPPVSRLGGLALVLSRGRMGSATGGRRFEQSGRRLNEVLYAAIERARAAPDPERHDVLSTLVRTHGDALSDAQLRDTLATLFLAGFKSTQSTLLWGFHHLLRSRGVLERLQAEVAAGERRYLDAVVHEALRTLPTGPGSSRIVVGAPYELSGHALPPGTEINVSLGELHRHTDHFPDAEVFRPERYLHPDEDTSAWLAFSAGLRRCVGATFAPFELAIIFGRIVERTELAAVGRPERAGRVGFALRNGVSRLPSRGVRVLQSRPPQPAR